MYRRTNSLDEPRDAVGSELEVVALQPIAIIDHVCTVDEMQLKAIVGDEVGGSRRCTPEDVQNILANVGEFHSKAGGSAANTLRGLASGFGVRCHMVGTRGTDEWGVMFTSSMKRAHVDTSKIRATPGPTGRCVILSCKGQRTMRTCLADAVRVKADELQQSDFEGAKWVYISSYAFYGEGLLQAAVGLAKKAGSKVALDVASYEVVRTYREELLALLQSGSIDCCFCNEDEAAELMGGKGTPEEALQLMAKYCTTAAVVTLGERGCIAMKPGEEVVQEPALIGIKVVDTTGAGDLFASGFLYGLLRGHSMRKCCQIGCLAGAAVVRTLGSELSAADWQWLHARLHGELAGAVVRDSASVVHQELLACYSLVEQLGRGVVYYGSARLQRDSPHWAAAHALGEKVAQLLGSTTWSGGGPGMMQAASEGALAAGGKVGGIRIAREAGTTVRSASYLTPATQVVCRFLSARKVALVDAGVRMHESERTAYVFLPGGLGTMDELFEIMTLVQLRKLGSTLPVPLILANYDGFYDSLIAFLQACEANGTLKGEEMADCIVAASNDEIIDVLAEFYALPRTPLQTPSTIRKASQLISRSRSSQALFAAAEASRSGAAGGGAGGGAGGAAANGGGPLRSTLDAAMKGLGVAAAPVGALGAENVPAVVP